MENMQSNNEYTANKAKSTVSPTRRSVLRTIGGLGTVGLLPKMAQAKDASDNTVAPNTTIRLGGRISGWVGRAPNSIDGKTNPSLPLQAGATYTIIWENLDGAFHDINIEDSNGNVIVGTKTMNNQGETQTLEFTATTEMAAYDCSIHPIRMRGSVTIQEGDGDSDDELPPVVGDSRPTDPDNDGLYEDVNGDGKVNHNDVTALFEHFQDDTVQNHTDVYDFNGNGRLDFDDIVELSNSL